MATRCPICKTPTDPADRGPGKTFPFCSERCKLIDLGRWFDGKYQIAVEDADVVGESERADVEE